MKGYKGLIVFHKNTKYGYVSPINVDSMEEWEKTFGDEYVFQGSCEVDVTFGDTTQSEIETLEKQIEKERAESLARINHIQGRIKDLQSLPYKPEVEDAYLS